jgi:hypothetical protein
MDNSNNKNNIEYFTLLYCEKHCSGFVVKGNYDDVPVWHKMCNCDHCDYSWWITNGIISYDGNNVEIVNNNPPIDFSIRDCGGFDFPFYAYSISEENGCIELCDNSPLKIWFDTYSL